MELSVTQENLSRALSTVGRVASGKTQLPILSNILLQTDGSQLLVAATNLEIASTLHVGAKIISPGSITVPARLVSEFVSSLPKATVTLKVENDHLLVSSGKFTSRINGVSAEEFPELPTINEDEAIRYTLNPGDFKQALNQTIITASNDATRPILTGIYWHSYEGALYLAGTDGYRLSERRLVETDSEVAAIVPASTLQEVLRSMHDDISEVEVLFDESQVRFRAEGIEITSRLIDGNFPDYRQLIPATSEVSAKIDRSEFMRIVKVSGLFARESGGSVTVTVDEDAGSLALHSIASELGENTSEASADIRSSGQVTLNSRYLAEALNVIEGSMVEFRFSGKISPCVMSELGENPNYIHIIMPLKS
ncbi:DNA polymerase III subunit beta [Candidatus Saccharibacteria bacterium]|nr:DNA polymerase III subunit beta [Candidatus Saccharibacteria bacterium]